MLAFTYFVVLENDVQIWDSVFITECYDKFPTLATVNFGETTSRGLRIIEVADNR